MPVSNEEISRLFENTAALLETKGDAVFNIRAYHRAARTINHLSLPLAQTVEAGTLDYPDDLLDQLDVVVASVQLAMGQDRDTMTRRIIKAMGHPAVTTIGHLSTRLRISVFDAALQGEGPP
jgi:DNA polymerase (family 10)